MLFSYLFLWKVEDFLFIWESARRTPRVSGAKWAEEISKSTSGHENRVFVHVSLLSFSDFLNIGFISREPDGLRVGGWGVAFSRCQIGQVENQPFGMSTNQHLG